MKQYAERLCPAESLYPGAPDSSAIAVMECIRWHSLSQADVYILSSALRRLSSSLPAATSGARELRGAGEALEHAAIGWRRSSRLPDAVFTQSNASSSACSTIELRLGACPEDGDLRTHMLCDLLARSAHEIGRLILAQCARAPSERACHDLTTRHLIHAGTALTVAARTLRSRPDVYRWT